MSNIYVLIGPPCSGKSTWVASKLLDAKVLSTDNLISWYGENHNRTYDQVWATKLFSAFEKIYNQSIIDELDNGNNIIIDRTNLTVKSRNKILSIVPENYKKIAVVFRNELSVLLERNKIRSKTGKTIPSFVMKNMFNTMEDPVDGEFDEIIIVGG